MNTVDLHNQLLHDSLEIGVRELRNDFEFENLFEPPNCGYCGNGTISVLAIIHPEIAAKYCPMCGRKLIKEEI